MDELGNTETSYYQITEPKEQKQEANEMKGKVREGMRLLEEIIARFDERIAFYNSNESITSDVETSSEEHLRAVIANRLTVDNLKMEKDYLEGLRQIVKQESKN